MESSFLVEPTISRFDEYLDQTQSEEKKNCLWKYRGFFNVDSSTVRNRLVKSLVPLKNSNFFEEAVPDLYGPIWVSSTLVLVLLFCVKSISWTAVSASGICAIMLGVPFACLGLINDLSFGHLISIYGYSFIGYLITIIIAAFLQRYFRILAVCIGGIWKSLVFIWNFHKETNSSRKTMWKVYGVIILGDLAMVYFINYLLYTENST